MTSVITFRIICSFYLAGWLLCSFSFFQYKKNLHRFGEFVLLFGLGIHLVYVGVSFMRPEYFPFYTMAGFLLVLSVLVMIIYFYLDYLYCKEIFEIIFPPLTVFFLILSNLLIRRVVFDSRLVDGSTAVNKAMLFVHASSSMLGYLLFGVACLTSIFFLAQEKKIKTKKLLLAEVKMPSLGFLDRLNYRILSSGFLFSTIGLLVGVSMKLIVSGAYEGIALRQAIPFGTWLFYALFLIDRSIRGLQGKATAILAILGFSAALISFIYEMVVLMT